MHINNQPPRMTWEQASQTLDRTIHNTVERNNDTICTILKGIKEKRPSASPRTREFLMEQLIAAKVLRANNRELLGCYDAMMRGV
jgi:hypothetical protein